jgi:hypothetical protein
LGQFSAGSSASFGGFFLSDCGSPSIQRNIL